MPWIFLLQRKVVIPQKPVFSKKLRLQTFIKIFGGLINPKKIIRALFIYFVAFILSTHLTFSELLSLSPVQIYYEDCLFKNYYFARTIPTVIIIAF